MYHQYQQPAHQSHDGQINGGHQNNVDPFEVRQQYRNELATLTFNSKPIITSLTIAAGDNLSVSKVIVQTIEERIRTAPPSQKLPTLYLIDSIIKNVGGPYLNLFARTIVNLFLDAYQVVDAATKASFEKVLGTWPNWNTPLFPRDLVARIERGVQSMRQQKQPQQHNYQHRQHPSMHVNPHFTDRSHESSFSHGQGSMYGRNGSPGLQNRTDPVVQVEARVDNALLQEIQLLMLQKQREIILNPNDQASVKQVAILQQLEIIVKTTQLTPENANMIRQQLAQLWTAAPSALPAASAPPAPSAPSASPAPSVPVLPGFPQPNMSQPGLPQVVPMVSTSVPPGMMIPPPIHHQQPTSSAASVIPTSQIPPFPGMPPHFAPHLPPLGSIPSPQTMVAPLPATSLPFVPGSMPPMPGMSPMPSLPSIPMSAAVASPTVAPAVASPIPPSRPAAIVPPAASDLIASLMQSGLLGPNGTLTSQLLQNTANLNRASPSPSPLMTAATAATAKPPLPPNTSITQVNQSEHDQGVMSIGMIELTSQDIQRRRPAAIQVMYGTPPLQCNQCGYRCPKSADAQKKMDAHLDWHFRQNRRMKDKAKKSHSRSWLVGEEDWIHSREIDLSQSQQSVFFDFGSSVSKTSKDEQALQEEINALKEQTVSEMSLIDKLRADEKDTITVAAAMNTIAKGCSVCKEKFIKIWNDIEEEWSYKNATVVDRMIYHATCHADLLRSNQRQAALVEAAVAAAAAVATASATDPSIMTTTISPMQTSTTQPSPLADKSSHKDPEMPSFQDEEEKHVPGFLDSDQAMNIVDSELPVSLKRKIEMDQEEQERMSSKKIILAQDS